ncbi:hypothetical protein [Oryzifoliimicrobium ureilyticus]|uniref:hypothetical protein n=1 Tax=Oryzifoliimicrobium ureilyticus TaxID=3113724 RepID=UPI003075F1E9
MGLRKFSYCLAVPALFSLAGCIGFEKAETGPVYDVRNALVTAGPGIASELMLGVGDRVNAAINATVRQQVYPRVILTIRIASVEKKQGIQKNRNVAHVSVDAASVDDGSVIAVSSFAVASIAYDDNSADQILAEDIAARVRSIFQLSTPRR